MSSKLISLEQAVSSFARNGMLYSSGAGLPVGADAIVFGRELVRHGYRDLHAVFHCNTQQLNLLCAAGTVNKIECGFSGLEGYGFANGLRRAVENGKVAIEDYSNLAIQLRLLGGALNWPFVPATVNLGSDIQWRSGFDPDNRSPQSKLPPVTDPFTGKTFAAFSPLRPDLAVIHVTLADKHGNAIMIGSEWSRFELSRAARKVVLVADHIVDTACMRQYPNLVRIPDLVVDAVVYWPFSAWPAASPGVHDSDDAHMRLMNDTLGSEEGYARYKTEYIDSYRTLDEYLNLIGHERLKELASGPTSFLLDPYRRWILPDEEIAGLITEAEGAAA